MSDLLGILIAFIWFLRLSNSLTHLSGGVDTSPSVLFANSFLSFDAGRCRFREILLRQFLPGNLTVAVGLFLRDAIIHQMERCLALVGSMVDAQDDILEC